MYKYLSMDDRIAQGECSDQGTCHSKKKVGPKSGIIRSLDKPQSTKRAGKHSKHSKQSATPKAILYVTDRCKATNALGFAFKAPEP